MQRLDLQGYSHHQRDALFPLLSRTFRHCGALVHDRQSLSPSSFEITLEIELRSILDLYAGLIASGLELTRSNHLALTHLCTCRKYLLGTAEEHQCIGIRIEIAFLPDRNPDQSPDPNADPNPDQNPDQPLLFLRSTRPKAA